MRAQLLHDSTRSMLRWRPWAVLATALLALSLVACGGSDDEGVSSSEAMTSQGSTGAPAFGGTDSSFGVGESKGDFAEDGAVVQSAPGAANTGTSPEPIADVLGRQVIRNGSMQLTVESVTETFDQIRGAVEQAGGFVASSSFSGREDSQRARMTVRVPAAKFDQLIADLRNMAIEVDSISTGSEDVTGEFTDLEASLRNLKAVESQYLTLLGEAKEIGDILTVQDRLNDVRYEIERVQGRLNLIENQTSLATLEVALFPEAAEVVEQPVDDGFTHQVSEAWESSLDFVGNLGTGLVVALVWSWWLIPVVVIVALVARRFVAQAAKARSARDVGRVDTPGGAA